MNKDKLVQNIIDQIKEAQIKLGYVKETVRLYYPVVSLNSLLGTKAANADELKELLDAEFDHEHNKLGELRFAVHEDRIEVGVPPRGVEYVYCQVENPAFLTDIIEFFGSHHSCKVDDICRIFEKYSKDYVCRKMPEGMDFDYVLFFTDDKIDSYCYCIKEEMEHTIYHRFTREDYQELLG